MIVYHRPGSMVTYTAEDVEALIIAGEAHLIEFEPIEVSEE